jgi:hypothetical protein
MANLIAGVQGDKSNSTEVHRLGHKRVSAYVQGWNSGLIIYAEKVGTSDLIRYTVYENKGSNNPSLGDKLLEIEK